MRLMVSKNLCMVCMADMTALYPSVLNTRYLRALNYFMAGTMKVRDV